MRIKRTGCAIKTLIIAILAPLLISSFSVREGMPDQNTATEEVEFYFFHETVCASCDGNKEFLELFEEKIGEKKELYPYRIRTFNVFRGGGQQALERLTADIGVSQTNLYYPLLIVNGKMFLGIENIRGNILKEYLEAGEKLKKE